jgi:hypothetical protein
MVLKIEEAEKFKMFAKVGFWGTFKAGKTHAALALAHALAPGGKIGVISSEHASSKLLKHRFSHQIINLAEVDDNGNLVPNAFSLARYEEAFRLFKSARYDVIIIDSLTHLWDAEGGILETVNATSNKFDEGWNKATPAYKKFVSLLLATRCHVIVTMRGKDLYKHEEYKDKNGNTKMKPVNIGESPIFRKGFGFELHLMIRMDNMVGHVDATAIHDWVPLGTEAREPDEWAAVARNLLDGLDGTALPEPSQQELDMQDLFHEYSTVYPGAVRIDNWQKRLLIKVLGSAPNSTEYTDDMVERVRKFVTARKVEKQEQEAASMNI